eukprot:TRINITY_DN9371_c0_g1_i2.p1 TRINITY_DN9371_c0_g1~~TRINITY_DN9371_c0_g1_i2.p1  ORF type:complete len:231 (+),score=33.37 TRINITY_DN9371_c0_g1_i2:162-854(+)
MCIRDRYQRRVHGNRANIFLFVPNLIGYVRIILSIVGFYFFYTNQLTTFFCYAISQILDAFDGYYARKLHQSSQFGAMLDMVCDRFSTAVFILNLCRLYQEQTFCFSLCVIIDITSHMYQMIATCKVGEKHHKEMKNEFKILDIYYQKKFVLFFMVLGSELFLLNLYIDYYEIVFETLFSKYLIFINYYLLYFSCPVYVMKQLISILQLISASCKLVDLDVKKFNEEKND